MRGLDSLGEMDIRRGGFLKRGGNLCEDAVLDVAGTQVLFHDLFTNGIIYLDIGFDLHTLPADLLPYVSLFGRALLETGVGNEDFVRLSQRIGRSTGGIRPLRWTSAVGNGTSKCGQYVLM